MSTTANFSMPLLHAAQAQKEITHNEALVLVDALLPRTARALLDDPASLSPQPGEAWIVGSAPVGPWSGQAARIAIFTEGGWRFATAPSGLELLDEAASVHRRFDGSLWVAYPAISAPTGGAVVDVEARAVLALVLDALRQAGLVGVT